jgi:LuxR family transcriptional regulator, maltose regulon positive regulatory protein
LAATSPRLARDAPAATQFVPPRIPAGWVARPRLSARLEQGLERPVTLLAAGAGTGKTTLLGAWASERDSPGAVGWLSLGAGARDRRSFWHGVLEALARGGAPEAVASLAQHPAEHVELIVPALVNALETTQEPVVLVLDDLHEIGDREAMVDLDRLLRHPPSSLRIVICTRIDPPLRLGRLRVAGELTEIREAELAFTEAETAMLLSAAGIDLEPADVRQLWRRTEGWAAGLRLAALTLKTHPDPMRFVADFAGDDAVMADYLLAEVLTQQPRELADFLLRTSIVDSVTGRLADALTGRSDGDRMLTRLEREHALVTAPGDDRHWYRYHPLLRELLSSQLHFRMPDEVEELHRRAAGWYVTQLRPGEALSHAAEAADWATVGALAGEHWLRLLARGELNGLGAVVAGLPPDRAHADPELALARAAVLLDAGDDAAAVEPLERASTGRGRVPRARLARFDLGVAAAGLLRARSHGDRAAAVAAARELRSEADLRAFALANLGIAELWTGELGAARRDLETGRRAADAGRCDRLVVTCGAHLAVEAVLAGRLERARMLADEVISLAARRGWMRTSAVGIVDIALGAVALERNRLLVAEAHMKRGAELLAHASDVPPRSVLRIQQARLYAASGHPERALEALDGARDIQGAWPLLAAARGLATGSEAMALAAQGRHTAADEAIAYRDGAPATADDATALAHLRLLARDSDGAHAALAPWLGSPTASFASTAVEMWLLSALAHDATADHPAAASALESALDEAEPGGVRRPFAVRGSAVGALLRRQLRHGTAHRSLVESLLSDLERPAAGGPSPALMMDPLSDREATVLRFLPTMMSNHEIASELFVSVNTVKTHLKSIYRKLDVADRRQAVRRGRELELLAP